MGEGPARAGAWAGLRCRYRRLSLIVQTARAVMTMSATVVSTDGARHMTMIAISQEFEPPRGSSLGLRMFCAFLISRAALGAAASSGCCRTVDVRLAKGVSRQS